MILLIYSIFSFIIKFLRFRFIGLRYKQLVEFPGNEMTLRLEYMSEEHVKILLNPKL